MILKTYKDFEIDISLYGKFSAAGIDKPFNTLEELTEAIDKASKIKYKPLDGFQLYQNKALKVTITRPASSTYNGTPRFWVKHENGKREILSYLVLDTPENRALIELWNEEVKAIKEANDRRVALEAKMKEFNINLEQI
jgi:hypothetical protein